MALATALSRREQFAPESIKTLILQKWPVKGFIMQHKAVPQRPLYLAALNTGREDVVDSPGGGAEPAIANSLAWTELLFLAGFLAESSRGVASLPSRKSGTPENCKVSFSSVYFGPVRAGLFGAATSIPGGATTWPTTALKSWPGRATSPTVAVQNWPVRATTSPTLAVKTGLVEATSSPSLAALLRPVGTH